MTKTITKLEAANRQLCTAIKMFFEDADAVSVHTLACAAREIFEKHCLKEGRRRMFDFVKAGSPGYPDKDLWNLLNKARNFFKHDGTALTDEIEFEDSMNDFALLSACTDCAALAAGKQPPEVQAFTLWYLAVEQPDEEAMAAADPSEAALCRQLQAQIDKLYPGLRTAPRLEKKRFGRRLLEDARAGRLVERAAQKPTDLEIAPGLVLAVD